MIAAEIQTEPEKPFTPGRWQANGELHAFADGRGANPRVYLSDVWVGLLPFERQNNPRLDLL